MHTVAYQFGRFRLLPSERQLLIDGEPAKLGGRGFDLLLALVERRERTVTRHELFELVWPGRIVEDQNLQVQVVALRKLLGPSAIATIPGRGYRFALPLVDAEKASVAPLPSQPVSARAGASEVASPLAGAPPTNVRVELSPLFGRVADIAAVYRMLAEHRLVTIAGPAGIGKTRLAQAVASQLRARFADGVWIAELAALTDGASIASTVARALGFAPSGALATAPGVAQALSSLSLLLVLDNCEHLLAATSAFVDTLLHAAPKVTVLTTSQEPLHVSAEQVFRLDPLALPPAASAEHALSYGAVSLFVARVQAVDQRFALTDANVGVVSDICRHLDGIPLAIELAAVRVPLLGVDGVCARLDERFRLLTGGSRTAPARHQTLRNALEWSHGLLSVGEQAVFRRLGVFAGGFTSWAAQQVAADGQLNEWTVLDHLGALVDKSLVLADGREEPRCRLLESSRAFAQEALAQAGETVALERRHAQAMAALFESADDEYLRVPTLQWMTRLAPDLDNWRRAVTFSLTAEGDPVTAIALVASATSFLKAIGLGGEAARAGERVAPLLAQHASPEWLARYRLAIAALGASASLPIAQAIDAARRAADGFRQTGDLARLFRALNFLSQYAEMLGSTAELVAADDEMQRIESPDWPALFTTIRRQRVAQRHRREGRIGAYRDGFAVEAQLSAQAGDERTAWIAQCHVAMAELMLGNPDRAIEIMRGVAEGIRSRGLQRELWMQFTIYARTMVEKGDPEPATPVMREAMELLRAQGALWWLGDHLALLPALRGDLVAAARLHGWIEAWSAANGYPRGPVIKEARDRLRARLEAGFGTDELARLLGEGASLSDAQVVALVLGEPA